MLEVSSFMGYELQEFQSDYSIFTNFKRDHQNWHRDLQEYLDAKMHVIKRTKRVAVVNSEVIDFAHEHNLSLSTPQNIRLFQTGTRDMTDGEDIRIN